MATAGCSGGEIERGVAGDTNAKRHAARNLAAPGLLRVEQQGQKRAHYLVDPGDDFAEEA